MHPQVESLLADLQQFDTLSDERRRRAVEATDALQTVDDRSLAVLLKGLLAREPVVSTAASSLLEAALVQIGRTPHEGPGAAPLDVTLVESIVALYRRLDGVDAGRHHLLRLLAQRGDAAALASLADLVVADPPLDPRDVAVVFTPLFRRRDYPPSALFPRLLDALAHASVAVAVLDLANYLVREHVVAEHPGAPRRQQLKTLLGRLAQQLGHLEERPSAHAQTAQDMQRTVGESVALVVSLCDALALIGDTSAVGKLYQALQLKHRRVRTEAAAALARLGEEEGRRALLELAAEPVARLRVLAYAEELGFGDQVDPQYATDVARAEAELALWLAQPSQFGVPPTRMELLDRREQSWPGYDEPVACFLFRFYYEMGGAAFSNVAIVGPVTLTLAADLNALPMDDLYALFAGWQAEHEDIYRLDHRRVEGGQHVAAQRLAQFLAEAGYTDIQPAWLGSFFGELSLVANAVHDRERGVAVVDQDGIFWRGAGGSPRPLGPDEVHDLYKGHKILSTFNAP